MKTKHPCSLLRDAIFLAAVKRPFTRWRELTGQEQERFIKQAKNVREQLAHFEPSAMEDVL